MKNTPVILAVDDQPQNIELLEAYLVPQGYKVIRAVSGEEALDILARKSIDLILLDVMMPKMDGFEVTRRVRQSETHKLIPIILVTVLRQSEDRVKGIEAGCDDFITKPFEKSELLARVRSLLKVKAYHDLMGNYQKELELEVAQKTIELRKALDRAKSASMELQHAHDLLRYIIEHNKSGVSVHDRDLNYIYVSQHYLDAFGVQEKDIIGKHHYDVFPDLPQKWRDVHQRVLKGEVLSSEEDLYKRADGSLEWTRWECRPWYEGDGSIGGIIVYTEVITDRKQREEQLRQLKDHLQDQVEEKTKELKQRVSELERFYEATIEREFRIKELRDTITQLKAQIEEKNNS